MYPYLLRELTIERPNQMWCADIAYIPLQGGFLYLVAIMDWASRRVLAWRLSNTMDTEFCLAALAEALEGYGIPEIFNTDQGSQFTSIAFTGQLEATGIRCSMGVHIHGKHLSAIPLEDDFTRPINRGYREIDLRDREHIRRAEPLLRAAYDDLHKHGHSAPGRQVRRRNASS